MENSKICPRTLVTDDIWPWFEFYRHYSSGHLLRAGGLDEQPAIYLAVMRLIEGVVKGSNGRES